MKYLANIPWLRFVNEIVVKSVLEEVDIIRMSEQGVILKKGDKSDRCYVVLEGTVSVYVHIGAADTKE